MLETIAFAFSIMGVIASVSSTYSFPLVSGKPYPPSSKATADFAQVDMWEWYSGGSYLASS